MHLPTAATLDLLVCRSHPGYPTCPAGIKAVTKDGVLKLSVPKTEQAKPKQIDIQVSE